MRGGVKFGVGEVGDCQQLKPNAWHVGPTPSFAYRAPTLLLISLSDSAPTFFRFAVHFVQLLFKAASISPQILTTVGYTVTKPFMPRGRHSTTLQPTTT